MSTYLDLRTRELDWYNVGILQCIERQWLEDKEARGSDIARKVEGVDRVEKIEVSESWEPQWGYWFGRCRGSRGGRKLRREESWAQALEPSAWGQLAPIHPKTILLNALLYGRPGKLKITFLRLPCQWSFSLESSCERHWDLHGRREAIFLQLQPRASTCALADGRQLGRQAKISSILLRITYFSWDPQ